MSRIIQTVTTVSFQAVTAVGATIQTFGDMPLARRWIRTHGKQYPGYQIDEIVTTVTRRQAYKPKPPKVAPDRAVVESPAGTEFVEARAA